MQVPINRLTGLPIPMQPNARVYRGGRSLLDNIYGQSSNPLIQANPPSRFRTSMMGGYGLLNGQPIKRNFTNTNTSSFVDPNIFDPYLRNKISPNIEIANQRAGIFDKGYPSQGAELADKGILSEKKETPKEKKGLLNSITDLLQSDYGKDFLMGMDTGYSKEPKSLMQTIQSGYQFAEAKDKLRRDETRDERKLDIEMMKALKDDPRGQPVYRYMIRDKNGQNYNVFSDKGRMYAMVNGEKVYQKDWQKTLGDIDVRTAGQQTFGVMSSGPFTKLEGDLLSQEKSLQSYARFLDTIGDTNTGLLRLTDKYTAWFKTFFGQDLTQEELSQQLASGELQRMIGASRKEIVGGGVMTEQDALRIIEALGGNIDQLQDPERVKSAISQIFSEKYNKYEQNLRNYNIQVRNEYGTKGYKSKNPIKFTKEQLKRFDAGITTDLGLLSYDDLSNADLLAINPENLDDEKLKLYFDELEKRKL